MSSYYNGFPLNGFMGFGGLGISPLPIGTDMGVNTDEIDPNAPQPMQPSLMDSIMSYAPLQFNTTAPTTTPTKPPQTFVPPSNIGTNTTNTTTATNTNTNTSIQTPPPAEVELTFVQKMQKFYAENQKAIIGTLVVVGVVGTGYVVHQNANKGLDGLGKNSKTLKGFKKDQFTKKYS